MTTDAKTRLLRAVTEKEWMGFVVSYAALRGWSSYHTFDSRNSPAGFPDLVLVKDGRLIVAELKAETGKVTDAQQRWLDDLGKVSSASGGAVSVHLWRPSDEAAVREVLG